MQRNEQERRREPRRSADRSPTQNMGQQPSEEHEEGADQDVTPNFFRAGEFAVRDPSLPERRSGEDKRKAVARRIQMHPDTDE